MEEFHFHDIRHTFAKRLVQAGIDLYKVHQLLGPKSPIMTQATHTTPRMVFEPGCAY